MDCFLLLRVGPHYVRNVITGGGNVEHCRGEPERVICG